MAQRIDHVDARINVSSRKTHASITLFEMT